MLKKAGGGSSELFAVSTNKGNYSLIRACRIGQVSFNYFTVTDFARFLGVSGFSLFSSAM
jgi:hypothetical protein